MPFRSSPPKPPQPSLRRLPHRTRTRLLSLTALALALGLTALVAAVGLPGAVAPRADAAPKSGAPAIYAAVPVVGPGMQVTLSVGPLPPVAPNASFDLRYTLMRPDSANGCALANSQSMPGANPVALTSDPQGQAQATITFTWPAALGSDPYYFCLYPASSSATPATDATASPAATATRNPGVWPTGELARSLNPFFVTRDATPQITVSLPPSGAVVGATIAIQITDWQSSDHQPPNHVWLISGDGYFQDELTVPGASLPDASGTTILAVTLPDSLPKSDPSSYYLLAGGQGIYQYSNPFQVKPSIGSPSSPQSTATPQVTPRTIPGQSSPSPLVYLLSALTLLIALGLVAMVVVLALRSRQEGGRQAMRQMGLDFEPLESDEPVSLRARARPGDDVDGPDGPGARDDFWQPPARPPTPPMARR